MFDVPLDVPLMVAGRPRGSADRVDLGTVTGAPLAGVAQAPPLLARRLLDRLAGLPAPLPGAEALARAGDLFAGSVLAGESPEQYRERFALATGIPVGVAARAADELRTLCAALPELVAADLAVRTEVTAGVRATTRRLPRGGTLAVVAPSNHPATHGSWLRALGYGLRVAVRPGARDPFTPVRLAHALAEAYDAPPPLLVLPGPHATAECLTEEADLAVVYGGEAATAGYAHRRNVAVRGPGRSKALLAGPLTEDRLDVLARAVAGDAGIRCTNISAVLTDQPVDEVAAALGGRLAKLPVHPPTDPGAVLPVRPVAEAIALACAVERLAQQARRYPEHPPFAELGDGSATLTGTVLAVDDARHPAVGVEQPFPFAVVAPWRPADGVAPLRHSLALLLLGDVEDLAEPAAATPSVHKVLLGAVPPWWSTPSLPHEGHLADFLLEARTLVTAEPGRPATVERGTPATVERGTSATVERGTPATAGPGTPTGSRP
ncbi:aldehyde dehydrogenase family protein [Plantactinospora sp. WMMB334]|uniref:aldehyde dehydrogenase family protein n=1 Tax=Plantactinospora sp. WMMB334 TaxID=3404119 RepID=UPI003B9575CE